MADWGSITKYDIDKLSSLTARGIPFPGISKAIPMAGKRKNQIDGEFADYIEFSQNPIADDFETDDVNQNDKSAYGESYWAKNILGADVFMPVRLGGIDLPNPCISIAGRMNIVETVVVGQEGTVKEEINTNDYDINIRCYVFDNSGIYPEDIVKELVELWRERKLLTIECVLTDFFLQAKDNCIITGISLPEQEANEDMQIIELSLRSDREYELIID